jgi:glucosylceramidase
MNRISVRITAICCALSFAVSVANAQHDTLITSGNNTYWQVGTITTGSTATVTVNESQKYQKWLGFGGCFNEKGWEALQNLSASDRDRAIRLLYGKDGCNFTWGRIPIGASDYAIVRYTLNQTTGDTLMNNFSVAHDTNYLIPFVKAAQAVKPGILFWASAWTPPTWMKTGATDAGGYDGGAMRNDPIYLRANALYTARFIEAYNARGIPIKAVFPQNEPGYTQNYPSCGWGKYRKADNTEVNGAEYLSDYVANYLWPTLQNRGLTSTDLWFGTLSNNTYASAYWTAAQSKAGTHIKGVGLQWNNVGLVAGIASAGYLVMQSEHQCGNYPWLTVYATSPTDANSSNFLRAYAPNNHAYGQESWGLIKNWITAGVNIYSAWNMVLDTGGFNLDQVRLWPQNALLAVNYQTHTLKVTPTYYVFRHLAQFLDTGAVRLGTTGGDALAFRNPDSSTVVVVYNSTSSAANMTISVRGRLLRFSVPAIGWATLGVGLTSPTSIKDITHNQYTRDGNGLRITCKGDGYLIALPSRESGRIELLTVTGRVLESRAIPQGSREFLLRKQASHAGLLLVRVVYGSGARTARLFNVR